jgi:hypothetical protein
MGKFELLEAELCVRFTGITISSITSDDLASVREGWKYSPSTAEKRLERLRRFSSSALSGIGSRKTPRLP